MKKLNRILSLIICLVFTVTSFAFVNTSVDAATTNLLANIVYSVAVDTTESGAGREDIVDYYGRSCTYMKRAQSKNTFIDFNVEVNSIDSTKEIVLETSLIFSKYIYRINLQPNKSTMGRITMPEPNNTLETTVLNEGEVKYDGWNDLKIVWKNVEGATAQVYFNGRMVAEFTVGAGHVLTSSANAFRLSFDAPGASKAYPEEVWIDVANTKITQTVDNKVNFYDKDGQLYKTQTVADGGKAQSEAEPSIDHYNFLGWYEKDATTPFNFDTALNNHLDLYAKYEAIIYDVVFIANGKEEGTLSGKYGEVVSGTIPEIPYNEGYTALGWFIGDTDEIFDENTIITGNMVINAKYQQGVVEKYNVTFKVDGDVYGTPVEVLEGLTVSKPEDPTKEHYNFVCWTLNGADFNFDTPITEDITLEAKFEPKLYKVSFYTDDTLAQLHKEDTKVYNTAYGELPVISKAGHKFLGWKTTDGADFTPESVITKETKVYAVWKSTTKVLLDEDITKYTSLTGNKVEFIHTKADNSTLYFDNGLVYKISESKPAERTFGNVLVGMFRIPYGEYDSTNRTQVFNDRFTGDCRVDITFDPSVSGKYTAEDGTAVSAPFGQISTGAYDNGVFTPILFNRLRNDRVESFNNSNASESTFNALEDNKQGQLTKFNYPTGESAVLQIGYDTATLGAYMTMNDGVTRAWGDAGNPVSYINGFQIQLMDAFKKGGYIRIKNIKVTQINDYTEDETHKANYEKLGEIMASLPASLVDDPNNATGIANLVEIDGVTWLSSNEEVLSSKTGIITPNFVDNEVVVTAIVKSGIFVMSKEYYLTVQKDASVEIKDLLNQTFKTEQDLSNWSFVSLSDGQMAEYKVDDNGLKITKLTEAVNPNLNYETKRYFAYYDFYHQLATDSYSTTESKDLRGVYDVTIDMSKYATSSVPMNLAIGYRNGNQFNSIGTLKINSAGTKFVTPKTAEVSESFDLPAFDSAKIKFRVDNIRGHISIYVDDELLVDRYSYYNALGEDARINSIKVEMDNNNNIGDFINIKDITVTQVVKNEFAGLEDIVTAASNIDITAITDEPTSVSGHIKELPKTVGGYNVIWKSLSNQIDIDTREIFHDATANKVYLTAEVYDANAQYPVYIKKTFELNVRAAQPGSDELDKFNINSLGKITNQDYADIRYDLNLPQVNGITWESSAPAIISNDGKIVDNAVITKSTPVTITASSNGVTRDYDLMVSPRTAQENLANGTAPLAITLGSVNNAKVSSDVTTSFTYTSGNGKIDVCNGEGKILVSMIAEADGIYFDYFGSDYKKYNVTNAKIDMIVMPDVDKAAIFVNGALVADYVTLKNKTDYVAKVESDINVGNITMTTDKYGMLQANLDNVDYFVDAKTGYAKADGLTLPTNVLTNAVATWTSSDTSILANNGTVTTPKVMTLVNLKFKLVDGENSDVYYEKTFEIAVDSDASKNIISNNVPTVGFKTPDYPENNLTDNSADTVFKALNTNSSNFEIVFDLGAKKTFNSMYVLLANAGIEGYTIYTSDDKSTWNKLTSGNMEGEVSELVRFNSTTATYVKFVIDRCNAKEIDISEIKLFMGGTELELAQYDMDLISINTAPTGTTITLPTTGVNGTAFTWESSNPSVISTTGVITKPQTATTVTLTAKANVNGQTITRAFDVYVDVTTISGPTQVGGGAGGGGGGGASSNNVDKTPIIGATDEDVYAQDTPSDTPVSTGSYKDVKETDWYSEAVKTLTEKGIVSGDGTGNFYPTSNVTREQFVKMILEAIDVEVEKGTHAFDDVVSGAWYEAYIATAVSKGIVNGVGSGNFGIGTNISRQDMAVLIERVLNYKEIEIEKADVEPFADASSVADYAANAVANMKAIGLIQGYNNNYNPKDNLTRAEAATVIASLLKLLAK